MALLIFSSIYFVSPAKATETKTLYPIADAYVDSESPSSNYGGSDWLYALFWDYEYIEDVRRNAYLLFDLSEFPSDVNIISAEIYLYAWTAWSPTAHVGAHYCPNVTWNEIEITWENAPSFSPTPSSVVPVPFEDEWYSWNVTSDVQGALGDKLTEVFTVEDTGESFSTSFYSKDAWAEDERARLLITYSKIPTTVTCSLSVSQMDIGSGVSITARLSPALEGKTVYIENSTDQMTWDQLAFGTTNSTGCYAYIWSPSVMETYSIRVRWDGDDYYVAAVSEIQSLEVIPEFPVAMILPLFIILTIIVTIFAKKNKPAHTRAKSLAKC